MTVSFTRYEPDSGKIHSTGTCDVSGLEMNAALYPDLGLIVEAANIDTDYVDVSGEPVVRHRPSLPGFGKTAIRADDSDTARVVLGEPFEAEIDGTVYQIDQPDSDGDYVLEITSPMPARYRVEIKHFPYRDYEAEVVAT